MSNPFFYGGRITEPAQFVGREAELRRIFTALETAQEGQAQHISVVGPRRMGKSSLLFHVTQIYQQRLSRPEKYRFAYIDLDDARCHSLPGLLHCILQSLDAPHPNQPTLEQFQDILGKFQAKQGVAPVLCLDEFEHLTQRKAEFPDAFFEAWRSLGNSSRVVFITASKDSLYDLIQQGSLTSSFHNIFTLLPLAEFTEADARALLARSDHPFSPSQIDALLRLTGRNPAKLQIAASLFYETPSLDAIQVEYQRQVEYIFGKKPSFFQRASSSLVKILRAIPGKLGRFVLEVFLKNKDASDENAIILGLVILVLLALVLLGIVNLKPWITLLLSSKL